MEGLFRRGGTWWARLAVPARLRPAAKRREFTKSTGTHEYAIAKIVAGALLAGWRRQLFQLEQRGMHDEAVLRLVEGGPALAGDGFVSLVQAARATGLEITELLAEAAAGRLALGCRVARESARGYVVETERLQRSDPARGGLEIPVAAPKGSLDVDFAHRTLRLVQGGQDVAEAVLAEGLDRVELVVFEAEWGDPATVFCPDTIMVTDVLALVVEATELERLRLARAALVSPARLERARAAHRPTGSPAPARAGKNSGMRFSEALERYCSDPDGLAAHLRSAVEQRQRRAGLMLFAEFMGDPALEDVDADTLRCFRDGPLKQFPANANRLPKSVQTGRSMKEMVEALPKELPDWPRMSAEMQRERMLWLIRFFDWAVSERYCDSNPGTVLRAKTGLTKAERQDIARQKKVKRRELARERGAPGDEDEEGREPFTAAQLAAIFGQPQFATGHGGHVRGNQICDPFEYWLPLLGLYHGLRIKEASQLHLVDVREVDGVWCLDINELTPDKLLKNEQSARLIPLNPKVVALGFLDYCARLREEGFQRVFPELTFAKSDARYAKESGRKMSVMLKRLGMPRDGSLVFHCLRHNANNALIRVPSAVVPGGDDQLKTYIRYKVMGHKVPENDANMKHYTNVSMTEMGAVTAAVTYELPTIAPFDIDPGVSAVRAALNRKQGARRGREDMGGLAPAEPKIPSQDGLSTHSSK